MGLGPLTRWLPKLELVPVGMENTDSNPEDARRQVREEALSQVRTLGWPSKAIEIRSRVVCPKVIKFPFSISISEENSQLLGHCEASSLSPGRDLLAPQPPRPPKPAPRHCGPELVKPVESYSPTAGEEEDVGASLPSFGT